MPPHLTAAGIVTQAIYANKNLSFFSIFLFVLNKYEPLNYLIIICTIELFYNF